LYSTCRIAAVVVRYVLVVADFARADLSISANNFSRTGTCGRTVPVGFHFAGTVTAVARQRVAIIALLAAGLIVDAIAAAFGCLRLASAGARAAAGCRRAARARPYYEATTTRALAGIATGTRGIGTAASNGAWWRTARTTRPAASN